MRPLWGRRERLERGFGRCGLYLRKEGYALFEAVIEREVEGGGLVGGPGRREPHRLRIEVIGDYDSKSIGGYT